MKARLGIAPIAWTNDDLPQLGGDTTLEIVPLRKPRGGIFGHGDRRKISEDAARA